MVCSQKSVRIETSLKMRGMSPFLFVKLVQQRRAQNQPSTSIKRPAIYWDHAVSWGWGVWASVRACVNDVPKIKIGKNQNQNCALIGRGSKPPDHASLVFGNRCQTKEVPRDLMFIFWKINIGGVHLIEGFPNATRQQSTAVLQEHKVDRLHRHTVHTTQQLTIASRRQTAPPHHTHNFCWHGLRDDLYPR